MEIVRLFMEKGADVREKDEMGRAALHYAVEAAGDLPCVLELVQAGLDVNEVDRSGVSV